MSGRVSGEVDAEDRARLEVEGTTEDLEAAEAVFTRVRRALGNPEAQAAGFTGAGTFRGLWRGTVDWPVFEGRFEGERVGYGGVDWGRAEWAGTLDTAAEAVESRPLVLRKGAGEIRWEGRAEIGWFGLRDALEGRARASSWPVEDLVTFMEWDVVATGLVTGEAQRPRPAQRPARARRRARRAAAATTRFPTTSARIESRWKGRVAEVTRGEVRLGGGTVAFRGSVTDDGVYDGAGEMEGVDLGALAPAPVAGRRLRRPALRPPRDAGHARRGPACARASPRPASSSATRASAPSRRASWGPATAGSRSTGAAAPPAWTWRSPAPWAPRRPTRRSSPSPRDRRASTPSSARCSRPFPRRSPSWPPGRCASTARSQTPAEIRAEAVVPDLQLLLPEFPLRASEPVRLTFSGGRLELADLHLAGEGTDLAVTGGVDVLGEGPARRVRSRPGGPARPRRS